MRAETTPYLKQGLNTVNYKCKNKHSAQPTDYTHSAQYKDNSLWVKW